MGDPQTRATFMALERTHDDLEELLLQHQDALLDRDFALARELFVRFDRGTRIHIEGEDGLLFPLYQARVRQRPGGGLVLFDAEHRKIEMHDQEILELIDALPADDARARRAVVRLIEAEALLKHLLDHHHTREHQFLFSGLDDVTTEDERRAILDRMAELARMG
ncbi:MAG TPA: hypothetical protein VGN26_18565 [Armatimonadota bacterium]